MRTVLLPDVAHALATLEAIASQPTVPYHEAAPMRAIGERLASLGIAARSDRYGQLHAQLSRGKAERALVLVAHTDHPGFLVSEARGRDGRVRVSGGIRAAAFAGPVKVVIHDDAGSPPIRAVIDDYVPDLDVAHNSPGHLRIRAEGTLRTDQWAVLDMPGLEVDGEELRLRAADDLAGCALIVEAMRLLQKEERPFDVHAAFTRAEETGLFGARLIAEQELIPKDAYVVSIEASNAKFAPAGEGIVVRVGDLHNTFSNEAERYLRVAQEQLALAGLPTQRRLLQGGTCEASAFVRLGWVATGIALPNINYHNQAEDGSFAPETVRLVDLISGIALLAEAAVAAGADASESWWPSAKRVPDDVREMLARPQPGSGT